MHKNIFKQFTQAVFILCFTPYVYGATTDLASSPLVTSSTTSVLPNIMFILDDSGSMDWDYMPDWANDTDPNRGTSYVNIPGLFANSGFNGLAYNPATTYSPPTSYKADGSLDTETYKSNTSANTSGWTVVKNDGYGVQSVSNKNLITAGAYYYTFTAGEYCTSPSLRTCITASSPSATHPYPASLRWCTNSSMTACQAAWIKNSYEYPRYAGKPAEAVLTLSGSSSTSVTGITVNGQQILSAATTSDNDVWDVASYIANNINNCTNSISGVCDVAGYSATRTSWNTVTIYAPYGSGAITFTPSINKSGTMTISASAFTGGLPGANSRTNIVSTTTSYSYPGSATKASTRTDCAGTTCTYDEEMTNYANWWSYYRTRMQMMKTAASHAFATIGSNYRVGYSSINNNTGSDFLNIDKFTTAHKINWYAELFAAEPENGTGLREALSKVGRLYAGKISTFNSVAAVDPMQYSCQQNFTILSTDGYWNGSNGVKLDGTTSVGNQDGLEPRPFNDGATVTYQKSTSQLQLTQTQLVKVTSQLQRRVTQIQQSTSNLRQQTTQLQTRTRPLQQQISQLQTRISKLQKQTLLTETRTSQLQKSTKSNGTWGAWTNVSSCDANNNTRCQYTSWSNWSASNGTCTAQPQDTSDPYNVGLARECRTNPTIAFADAATCDATTVPNSSGLTTQCQYTEWPTTWSDTGTCSAQPRDTTDPYNVAIARECQTIVSVSYANAPSCTVISTPDGTGKTTQCRYDPTFTAWSGTATCTAASAQSGPSYSGDLRECRNQVTVPFTNASSCTVTTVPDASGNTFQCEYTAFTAYSNASSCTPQAQSPSSPYTVGTAVQCQTTDTGFLPSSTCAAGTSGGQTVTCNTVTTGPTPVASCSSASASSGNSWTQTTCNNDTVTPATGASSCTAVSPTSPDYIRTSCATITTGPTVVESCTAETASAANSWTTTTCSSPIFSGGVSNTLADVAEYYYKTDLRTTALDNCTGATGETLCSSGAVDPYNNVPTSGDDGASTQHMTTFTLGLGASGYMQYSSSYQSATEGDYFDVKNGTSANPAGGICSWQASGTCNWPTPSSDSQANIDDLWHAAVNGRGSYFSATNPATLSAGLSSALAGVSARTGASAAATTSNPNITSGDNFVFSSTFTTQNWDGELVRQQLDLSTGETLSAIDWAAQARLDARTYTSRTIYTYSTTGTDHLQPFVYSSMDSTSKSYFEATHVAALPLSQFCSSGVTCLSAVDQTSALGANLVNYLRGERTNEGISTDTTKYYRQRNHVLGDIVNAEAVYVKGSLFNYGDLGYGNYIVANASRQGMVYAASNDGMLHAFYAADGTGVTGGEEAWAYIPSFVLPNLYKLADKNYANQHQYYVDGTPVVGDICISDCDDADNAEWRTILVGGLNGGGRGYYALDITDPASPKVLWEFTHDHMGYTYGNPTITKLANGTWVVLLTSGYNNVFPGDGQGRLFVINAATGALETTVNPTGTVPGSIATGVGSDSSAITGVCTTAPCPSGLAKIIAKVANPATNNTVEAVYGGDLYGNIWRFDVNGNVGPAGYEAQLLAVLKGSDNFVQPITTKPEVGLVSGVTVVFVGTGKYMGATDPADTKKQSIYAIKDALSTGSTAGTAIFNNPRSIATFVQQVQTSTTCPSGTPSTICTAGQIVRTSTENTVNFATDTGWFIDLLDNGERANTDPTLSLGTLGLTTNVPESSACTVGGYSYRYFLDYRTGAPVSTSPTKVVGSKLGNALATRPVYVRLPNNTVVELTRTSDGTTITSDVPIGGGASATRRTSWRELITEE